MHFKKLIYRLKQKSFCINSKRAHDFIIFYPIEIYYETQNGSQWKRIDKIMLRKLNFWENDVI